MLNKTIIVDKGVLGFGGQNISTSYGDFTTGHLIKYFGSTIAFNFNGYKHLSFSFQEIGGDKTVVNGFLDDSSFLTFINNKYSDGISYTTEVELTIYMDIDEKMPPLTIYAKNAKLGQLKGRRKYRTGKIVESDYPSSWSDPSLVDHLRRFWEDIFSEDLTSAFLNAHPKEMKGMFWTKKDCDKLGVPPAGTSVGRADGSMKLYCVQDSNPGTDTIVVSDMSVAFINGKSAFVSTVTSPKYYVLREQKILDVMGTGAMDWGLGMSSSSLKDNHSIISVHGIQISADLGSGVKTYRAIRIDPVGVDTIYFDYLDDQKYRVFSITRAMNSNVRLKELPFNTNGVQRLGRVKISDWLSSDYNDSTSNSIIKGIGDTHFVYQDKITGKFSDLSQSKMRHIKDLRFRVPFFSLVS